VIPQACSQVTGAMPKTAPTKQAFQSMYTGHDNKKLSVKINTMPMITVPPATINSFIMTPVCIVSETLPAASGPLGLMQVITILPIYQRVKTFWQTAPRQNDLLAKVLGPAGSKVYWRQCRDAGRPLQRPNPGPV
jgi:hypothetical protein